MSILFPYTTPKLFDVHFLSKLYVTHIGMSSPSLGSNWRAVDGASTDLGRLRKIGEEA
jgi:hypothetical protein